MNRYFLFLLVLISCDFNKKNENNYVARVGEEFLDYSYLNDQIPKNISIEDSVELANKIISDWATSKLLLQNAQNNLNDNEKESIDEKSKKYRDNLILSDYKNKISKNNPDTIVTDNEIKVFFENNSKNFALYDEIVQGRYLKLNKNSYNINEIKRRFNRFNIADRYFFDSISIQLLNYSFNDSIWINKNLFFNKIPTLNNDEIQRIVKNNLFYIKEDSLALYLIKINNYKKADDYAPLDYIYNRINELISNKKKINYLNKVDKELIDEAINKNIFELYE